MLGAMSAIGQAPQFENPSAPEYASVSTTGPASLRARFEKQRYIRPWRLCVTVDVFDDSLSQGDSITLTLGDTSGGSLGSRAQTFCKEAFEFRVAVDWCGTWVYTEVPSPKLPIISGPAHRLVVLGPSETTPDEDAWIGIKAEDLWGNPSTGYNGTVEINADGLTDLPETYQFQPADLGIHRFEGVKAPKTGIYRVRTTDSDNRLEAKGNPLSCVDNRSAYQPFWGDLHGQSEETVGTNPGFLLFSFCSRGSPSRLRRTSRERLPNHRSGLDRNPKTGKFPIRPRALCHLCRL